MRSRKVQAPRRPKSETVSAFILELMPVHVFAICFSEIKSGSHLKSDVLSFIEPSISAGTETNKKLFSLLFFCTHFFPLTRQAREGILARLDVPRQRAD